ncbi:sirohydrochlorin cobaltochelatase [Parendozoicomonas haliclonae]|uniref:Sirohydrochlorin cobaltochelatase CbiKP n=1 Tax=Parendozoicomonas haliclonae TaxID=1960125 RepID=A0A1X7ALH6_9GAMM|nr:sirohydrochlorin cobaltochelatase [Parendozoicomonas haliclonae]SMA48827.1 Sirohydrochlorin cobaltochelatase CbiKP precursor [Parendozoicomonas haliclonae]
MKRFRHYDKDTAIVLACFGSVVEHARYEQLADTVREAFPDYPVEIAITSRMVIKKLAAEHGQWLNLPQTLANLDMQGYRRIIVASCYLYPTDEHAMVINTVKGFENFSLSRFGVTPSLINKTNTATKLLKAIHDRHPLEDDMANLYIIHGAPELDNPGYSAIQYTEELLARLDPYNFSCSLEGAFPFNTMSDGLIRDILTMMDTDKPKLRLVPLLLVSGNHFENDLMDIRETLSPHFEVELAEPVSGDRFCLLDMPEVPALLIEQIKTELKKLP